MENSEQTVKQRNNWLVVNWKVGCTPQYFMLILHISTDSDSTVFNKLKFKIAIYSTASNWREIIGK